jgi:hypothetical protein
MSHTSTMPLWGLDKNTHGQSKPEDAHVKTAERVKAVAQRSSRGFTETVLEVGLKAESRTRKVSAGRQPGSWGRAASKPHNSGAATISPSEWCGNQMASSPLPSL